MSNLFLSHSSFDEIEAVAVKEWLMGKGWEVFLDLDPERGLKAGERWQEALRRAADRCEAVVFLISPKWANSKWCLAEFLLAKSLKKLIFGVIIKQTALGELPPEMTSEWQLCNLSGPGKSETIRFTHLGKTHEVPFLADGLKRLKLGLENAGLSAIYYPWPPPSDPSRSPYRGLEPQDRQDAAIFFGRDVEILQGMDTLRGMRAAGNAGLFIILGASGAGKSSFLRAGLWPRLKRDDRHFYPLDPVRPERCPLSGDRGLAQAIKEANRELNHSPINPSEIIDTLNQGVTGFEQLLRNIQRAARNRLVSSSHDEPSPTLVQEIPSPTLILPVDQAEELFSGDATDEANQFLRLIGDLLRATLPNEQMQSGNQAPLLIVAFTIRSDRYQPLQTAKGLESLKAVLFDALKPISKMQFKEIIVGPADRATKAGNPLEIEPRLTDTLLEEYKEGADTLPLLSLTLARLERDYGQDGDLKLSEYQKMGGMAKVIETEAESVLSTNPAVREAQLDGLHDAFIPELAAFDRNSKLAIRRVSSMDRLPAESHEVIEALIEKRLLLADERDGKRIVEVAHESLLRNWSVLTNWLKDERDDLRETERLEEAVANWEDRKENRDWLQGGERLAIWETLANKKAYKKRLKSAAKFLQLSREQETKRIKEEERQRQTELEAAKEREKAAQEKQAAAEERQRITQKLAEAEQRKAEAELRASKEREESAREREEAAAKLAAEQTQAAERAQADSFRLGRQAQQLFVAATVAILLAAIAGYGFFNAEKAKKRALSAQQLAELAERKSNALRLTAESEFMISGGHSGGEERAMLQLVAANKISPTTQTEEAILDTLIKRYDTKKIWTLETRIRAVAFSPNGKHLVSANVDKTLTLWDVRTGRLIGGPMHGHDGSVLSVAFSLDGSKIVSGSWDKTVRVWNASTGQPLGAPIRGHEREVMSVAFSPDGSKIVSGSWDTTVRVWNASDGKPLVEPIPGHEREVMSVAFSPDGSKIVSGSGDMTIRLWDVKTGKPIGTPMLGHEDGVTSVAFSRDGRLIVSGSRDKTVRLWSTSDLKKVGSPFLGHKGEVTSVAFSPDGENIISGSRDRSLRKWNSKTGQPVGGTFQGHKAKVSSVAFSIDGKLIASGSRDRTIRIWDATTDKSLGEPEKQSGVVLNATFNSDHTSILAASWNKKLWLWNSKYHKPLPVAVPQEKRVISLAFSQDQKYFATGTEDGILRVWDASNGLPIIGPIKGHERQVMSIAFSPDGSQIASGSDDKTIRMWDAKTLKARGERLIGHEDGVTSVAFSPNNSRVVSGSGDNTVRMWNAKNGKPIGKRMVGHEDGVASVAFSPDGSRIISGSSDNTVRMWDAEKGDPIGNPMLGHEDAVGSVAFSPNGSRIVSGSSDNTVRMWDAITQQPVGRPMQGHKDGITSVAFSSDGMLIVSGSKDRTVRVWQSTKPRDDKLCAKLTRNMSHQEWKQWVSPDVPYKEQCPGLPIPPDKPATEDKQSDKTAWVP